MTSKRAYSISDRRVIGLLCGIVAGISYGTNPLFAKPLLESGVPVLVMLFFRYALSATLLGIWMVLNGEKLSTSRRELGLLVVLGLLFAGSSIFLFASYEFIPSGLATTLVYLYPVFVALIMVFLHFYPSWQTWLSIIATFGGIILLSSSSQGADIQLPGIFLAVLSALSYAHYLVIVNRSSRIKNVSERTITFYALATGTVLFFIMRLIQGGSLVEGVDTPADWANLVGLAIVPTILSLLTLAVSTRFIGPTKTSILGVFEPLTAILIGTALFGEPLTWKMGLGIVICVAAVVFMILKPGSSASSSPQ
ncbi:MAG: DMT family transporter [Bacteroidales bacterium]|nr:DMT family transporter [Bacteroidales bacterium]